jgi:hypothetical protein
MIGLIGLTLSFVGLAVETGAAPVRAIDDAGLVRATAARLVRGFLAGGCLLWSSGMNSESFRLPDTLSSLRFVKCGAELKAKVPDAGLLSDCLLSCILRK